MRLRPLIGWPLLPLPDEHGRLACPALEAERARVDPRDPAARGPASS